MVNIVLVEPEIPMNTGNIARTCAVTGSALHLVRPLGFSLEDRYLKRAGLDYWHMLDIYMYEDLAHFLARHAGKSLWLLSTRGRRSYTSASYGEDPFLLFGRETAGLPQELIDRMPERCIRIPMVPGARSLNLSNSAAIVAYEALRQQGFAGLDGGA